MLDLFDGKLSLTDILQTEIPFLESLKEAKYRAIEKSKQPGNQK